MARHGVNRTLQHGNLSLKYLVLLKTNPSTKDFGRIMQTQNLKLPNTTLRLNLLSHKDDNVISSLRIKRPRRFSKPKVPIPPNIAASQNVTYTPQKSDHKSIAPRTTPNIYELEFVDQWRLP